MSAVPTAKAVKDLMEAMLGRDTDVGPGTPALHADLARSLVAVYTDDARQLAAVIGMDLALAARTAAALGLVPAGIAEDSIAENALSPSLADNASELCNVLTTLLNETSPRHLRLHKVALPGAPVPPDAASLLMALGARLDLAVDVNGYGKGRFWLSSMAA